jgi:hypothetical protein
MPNDAAAEKAGSAEHGDGATVRCHHDSNSLIHVIASLLDVEGPIRAIEQPLAIMKSFTGSPLISGSRKLWNRTVLRMRWAARR